MKKPTKSLAEWTDKMIDNLLQNYERSNAISGGAYTKAALTAEKHRRLPSNFDIPRLAHWIVKAAQASDDGRILYGDIWREFRPEEPWIGHGTQSIVKNALGRVIGYSLRHNLP